MVDIEVDVFALVFFRLYLVFSRCYGVLFLFEMNHAVVVTHFTVF